MTAFEAFGTLAPEFAQSKETEITRWLELTQPLVSQKKFGTVYPQALALLTAHRMKLAGLGESIFGSIGDSLRVSSYSEGGASVSFSSGQQSSLTPDAELALTAYGLQFLELRRLSIVPITIQGV